MERMVQATTVQPAGHVKSESAFAGILIALFGIAGFFGLTHHGMWRDELRPLLIAKNSTRLIALYHNLQSDRYVGGWHICLFLPSKRFSDPFATQVYHLVGAVLFCSPFTRLARLWEWEHEPFRGSACNSTRYGSSSS
jgi:hypothetical protein